jgi:hypothetical protein
MPPILCISQRSQRGAAHALASVGSFGSLRELLCGGALLHTYRVLERQLGSAKFASLLLFAAAAAWGAEAALGSRWVHLISTTHRACL